MKYTQSKGQDTGRRRTKELIQRSAPTRDQLATMPVRDMSRREKKPAPSRRRPSDYRGQSMGAPGRTGVPGQNGSPMQNGMPMQNGAPINGVPMQNGTPMQNNAPMQNGAPTQNRAGAAGQRVPPRMRQRPAQYKYTNRDSARRPVPDSEIVAGSKKNGDGGAPGRKAPAKKSFMGQLFSPVGEALDEGKQGIATAARLMKSRMGEFSIDAVLLSKAAILTAVMIVAILAQTTFYRRFSFFGTVPDLMLPFVIAVAASEGERWGGVFGLAAAFVSEALGGIGLTILPIIYMPVGYVCGLLGKYYLTGSVAVRTMYSLCSLIPRALATWIYVCHTYDNFDGVYVLVHTILPEAAITFICSLPMHFIIWAMMRPFHQTREQRVL